MHGDDFTTLGARRHLGWFHDRLREEWTMDVRAIVGPPSCSDCEHSTRILNGVVTWTDEGILWEADPRHVDIVV